MAKKNSKDFSLAKFTDEELYMMRDEALDKYDRYVEEWAIGLKEITDEKDFDQYSRKSEKKVAKLNKRFLDPMTDIEIVLATIQEELDKRDNYNEQQRYMEGGNYQAANIEDDEFLKREQEKTERIRSILNNEDDDV